MGKPSFGDLVKSARKELGPDKTQEWLAKAADYSTAMISKIEAGARVPVAERARELARVLGQSEDAFAEAAARAAAPAKGAAAAVSATKLTQENRRRVRALEEANQTLEVRLRAAALEYDKEVALNRTAVIEPFLSYCGSIKDLPQSVFARAETKSDDAATSSQTVHNRVRTTTAALMWSVLSGASEGAMAGLGLGAATGAGLYTAVASFATASTGTAIASLSGASATSATLAWLGGGALSAGGAGIAGGIAVLSTVVIAPVVVGVGVMLAAKGGQMLAKQQEAKAALDLAEEDLEHNEIVVSRFEKRVTQLSFAFSQLRTVGSRQLAVLGIEGDVSISSGAETLGAGSAQSTATRSTAFAGGATSLLVWGELGPDRQRAVSELARLCTAMLATGTLPILPTLESVEEPDSSDTTDRESEDSKQVREQGSRRFRIDALSPELNEYIDYSIWSLRDVVIS